MRILHIIPILLVVILGGCATLAERDAPSVSVVGLEPLDSEGLELRFALKLRVQNPNDSAITYDGLSVSLDLDGEGLANGVSDASGEIARFSDAILTLPVSISAFSAIRQLMGRFAKSEGSAAGLSKPIKYSLSGKLGGTGIPFASRFSSEGELNLFQEAEAE